ncbi:MAG TPA: hypothetical protein VGP07_23560, partial [Polyangia bacterium]
DLFGGADVLEGGGVQGQALWQGQSLHLAIDTSAPLTFFGGQADGTPHMTRRSFDLLGTKLNANGVYPKRASFLDVAVLPVSLDPAGPQIVLGADLLKNFSLEINFPTPSITFWLAQNTPDAFFGATQCAGSPDAPLCSAVLHFGLLGGGELTAVSEPDFLGLTGPVDFPATRALLRACAAPDAADPVNDPQPMCCTRADAVSQATGANLSLLIATGIGPVVLSQSAWNRVVASQATAPPTPAAGAALSIPWLSAPLTTVTWSTLPRMTLVDLELDPSMNPGACVELARARRMEWIERHETGATPACFQACDADPSDSAKAQNAAGYLEIGGPVDVAIVPDGSGFLESLRAELRQQGPQVDGLLGTNMLATTTTEINYGSSPSRAIFSCAPGTARTTCWASPRCPRQASPGDLHSCFGLPPQARPEPTMCLPSGCS